MHLSVTGWCDFRLVLVVLFHQVPNVRFAQT
jgi:hypothetical protein